MSKATFKQKVKLGKNKNYEYIITYYYLFTVEIQRMENKVYYRCLYHKSFTFYYMFS